MTDYNFTFVYTNGVTIKFTLQAHNYTEAWDKALIKAIRGITTEDYNVLEGIYAEDIIED